MSPKERVSPWARRHFWPSSKESCWSRWKDECLEGTSRYERLKKDEATAPTRWLLHCKKQNTLIQCQSWIPSSRLHLKNYSILHSKTFFSTPITHSDNPWHFRFKTWRVCRMRAFRRIQHRQEKQQKRRRGKHNKLFPGELKSFFQLWYFFIS